MSDEKALDKIDIASELKTLSPIEQRSIELKKQAEEIKITDKATYAEAKKVKRELVGHRTGTKDLRLTFTRKLDNLKAQFIKKQDEVLEPSISGEALIKDKIEAWEKAEAEKKAVEEKRMQDIVNKLLDVGGIDRKTGTLEDVKRERARLKMERGLLDVSDRNKVAVKNAVAEVNEHIDEAEQFIIDRIEQERVAEEQRKEQERLDAERKKLEEDQAAAANVGIPTSRRTTVETPSTESLHPAKESVSSNPTSSPSDTLEPAKGFEQVEWRFEAAGELTADELLKIGAKIVNGETQGFINREVA